MAAKVKDQEGVFFTGRFDMNHRTQMNTVFFPKNFVFITTPNRTVI